MRHQRAFVLCIMGLLVLSLLSCAPKQAPVAKSTAAQPPAPTVGSSGGQPTAAPKGQATSAPKAGAAPTSSKDDDLSFAEVKALEKLNTYRLQYKWRYETDKGEGSSMELLNEVVKQPPASHEIIKFTDNKSKAQDKPIEIIRIGNVTYTKMDDKWLAMQQTQDLQNPYAALMTPDLYFGAEKGKYVGKETVNGMEAKHYRYDAKTVNPMFKVSKLNEYKADVWVSTEFNVYVKAVVRLVGVDEQNVKHTYDWETALLDINKPLTIKAPEGVKAPGLPDDIPVMEGAKIETSIAPSDETTMTTLTINKPKADVEKFYTEQMKAKGWAPGQGGIPGILLFTKGARQAQIIINEESGKTTIMISVSESGGEAAPTRPAATRTTAATRSALPTPVSKTKVAATPTPNLLAGIPIMDGAADVDKGDDYLNYTVAKTLQEVNDFYKAKMTAAGWKLTEAADDLTGLTVTKDNRTAMIYLEERDEGVAVNISVSAE